MIFILFIVVCLVAWALHLMQEAVQRREFSLMLAGLLVSTSAAAMMAVYFLMGHYVGYVSELSQRDYLSSGFSNVEWSDVEWSDVEWSDVEWSETEWTEMSRVPVQDVLNYQVDTAYADTH